ncbi:DUF2179 domain-containing protein [Aquibacillus sediminis]|uniref:DUF2179 domain-containing protein n=1 Tax=Aquibacillus sediminis TaxID=2574734 RepID=UPI001107E3A0|nr:DUF2179 domain-containing protein [Aquibacillus sediminis]
MKDILLILLLQLIYVPVFSLRTIMLVKGYRLNASLFGFIESVIYVFGLSIVLTGEQSILSMIVYALGFSIGILIGSEIEEEMAIGYITLHVILTNRNKQLIEQLRVEGYGVTIYVAEGKDADRFKLEIITKRNQEEGLIEMIKEYEPQAFIVAYEPRYFKGGFILKAMKKRRKKKRVKQKSS